MSLSTILRRGVGLQLEVMADPSAGVAYSCYERVLINSLCDTALL
jgi:hypothetical protein